MPILLEEAVKTAAETTEYPGAANMRCGPLLQYTLLAALQRLAPEGYAAASATVGLTKDAAWEVVQAGKLVVAERAVRVAGMISRRADASTIFAEAGRTVFELSYHGVPAPIRAFLKWLPRRARIAFTLRAMRRMSYKFLGDGAVAWTHRDARRLDLRVTRHLFAGDAYRIDGGGEFYRAAFTRMFELFAQSPCRVEIRSDDAFSVTFSL
jgi:hypothetical protein